MHKWNKIDPNNLEYIEKQIEAIKANHNITNENENETEETRALADILEEQLITLKQIQHVLEEVKTAVSISKKGWKRFF